MENIYIYIYKSHPLIVFCVCFLLWIKVDARIYFLFYLKYVFMYNLFEKKCKTKKFSAGNGWQLTAQTDSLRPITHHP
jgi:hypothetical protein